MLGAQSHPRLTMTASEAAAIRSQLGNVPRFDASLAATRERVDAEIALGPQVPVPKDLAGGYTHERHKQNFFILQQAGSLYQITGEERYAAYVREVLMAYAELYPTFERHPADRSYAPGKFFWQCLNDANWLVYVSQAYDCIYEWLPAEERAYLENDLFRPHADYLSVGNPRFFNRIHNHSTWACAAVGMIGLVMDDEELVQRALLGLQNTSIDADVRDNDGGFITQHGQGEAGFLAQLDQAIAPGGYFSEGPYYHRYAIYPYLVFAQALANQRPDLDIFAYRDSILNKSIHALLQQTDAQGLFFPINDAQKGMSYHSRELITAVDLIYYYCGKDGTLLSVAAEQDRVLLDAAGFAVASDLMRVRLGPFTQSSQEFRDGVNGDQGALGILRARPSSTELSLVMKYTVQGLSHDHFDMLSFSLYDEMGEVIQDYGAARWVNINQKSGGGYLRENRTWAKQTVAHNTLVVDEASHFGGDVAAVEPGHAETYYFNGDGDYQVASAKANGAYANVHLERSMFLIDNEEGQEPFVLDLIRGNGAEAHQYDLPLLYQGELLDMDISYKAAEVLQPLGDENGYQHLWLEGSGEPSGSTARMTWMRKGRFFTLTRTAMPQDIFLLARLGANDPEFNLRRDPVFIHRRPGAERATFVSVIEPHGSYSPVDEIPHQLFGRISELELVYDDADYTVVRWRQSEETVHTLAFSWRDNNPEQEHRLELSETEGLMWTGVYEVW